MKSYLPSLGEKSDVLSVWKTYPQIHRHMAPAVEETLRGNKEIGEGQSEFVFAYVSGLNDCKYCFGSHTEVARLYGLGPEIMDAALADPEDKSIDSKLSALLVCAKTLTLNLGSFGEKDAQAVMEAGWSEEALHHTICIVAMAAFMNRFTIATGLDSGSEVAKKRGKLLKEWGYAKAMENV